MFSQGTTPTVLKLQAGSVFTENRFGLDTGSRTFRIDRRYTQRKKPRKGQRDSQIVNGGWANMFVDSVEVTSQTLQLDLIRVQYLGVMTNRAKPPVVLPSSQSESTTLEGVSGETTFTSTYFSPRPQITFVDVISSKPDIWEPGTLKDPPGWEKVPPDNRRQYFESIGLVITSTLIWQGWIVKEMSAREAGGKWWERTIVYSFERQYL